MSIIHCRVNLVYVAWNEWTVLLLIEIFYFLNNFRVLLEIFHKNEKFCLSLNDITHKDICMNCMIGQRSRRFISFPYTRFPWKYTSSSIDTFRWWSPRNRAYSTPWSNARRPTRYVCGISHHTSPWSTHRARPCHATFPLTDANPDLIHSPLYSLQENQFQQNSSWPIPQATPS